MNDFVIKIEALSGTELDHFSSEEVDCLAGILDTVLTLWVDGLTPDGVTAVDKLLKLTLDSASPEYLLARSEL